ncbi:hypothetical protein PR202_ga31047 [Eleusine coracana subsp. coracana]|uniref:DUF659 domain-containing protein n=1 Tax=Eleusine coracana subsp. coracana TaxID=191504 RepID=A0AAV5DRF4_ELECO|nr:hypothetical protein PR202_ga31047 [Eleusine coracana subsp. coracana]
MSLALISKRSVVSLPDPLSQSPQENVTLTVSASCVSHLSSCTRIRGLLIGPGCSPSRSRWSTRNWSYLLSKPVSSGSLSARSPQGLLLSSCLCGLDVKMQVGRALGSRNPHALAASFSLMKCGFRKLANHYLYVDVGLVAEPVKSTITHKSFASQLRLKYFLRAAKNLVDVEAFVAAAIEKLPPTLQELAKDPNRKAKSKDPRWKYGFWPILGKKEVVHCIFCKKEVNAGIKRFKQHLAGGFGDVEKCPKANEQIRKEMLDYLVANSRSLVVVVQQQDEEKEGPSNVVVPSSGTKAKVAAAKKKTQATIAFFMVTGTGSVKPGPQKYAKSVSSMMCKTPEQVVDDIHSQKTTQITLEHLTKKTKEAKEIVDDHIADFLYENKIPFNTINSRSFEVMVESIVQYGPGYHAPSYHALRVPLLEKAVKKTLTLREQHEAAWKEYGCTLMSDGWTDTRHRHIINFLANSSAGTFFLGSHDASGRAAEQIVLSVPFWTALENCMRASQPVLIALRIADGDETPAAPEIMAAMDLAKDNIKNALKDKPALMKTVLDCFEERWGKQMEQKLYGAALFLNLAKLFSIRDENKRQASRLRSMFDDVLWKMIPDDEEQNKISAQADDYQS